MASPTSAVSPTSPKSPTSLKSPVSTLLSRAGTSISAFSEDAVPDVDPTSTAGLLAERLQAWKHAAAYLEDYMTSVERIHRTQAREYEKALKTIAQPLREGHHFDQSLGGLAGFFENMRVNTQALINTNVETEKSIKGSILPILERLHKEIKHKAKELASGAQKGARDVDKARNLTQKGIELLGQHTATFESTGGKMESASDPYVVRRGIMYRLHQQVLEENNYRNDLIAVQSNFQAFEAHVIQTMQQAMEAFTQLAGGQGEKVRALHSDMLGAIQRVPPNFEWKGFVSRSGDRLADPNEAPRSVQAITFPNMDHTSTKPLIEGSLERKSRNKLSWGYSTGYYVVTPARFLHEFKDSDDARKEPRPELFIYLPDAMIGNPNGEKFNIKGKDRSKSISSKLAGSAELAFKAHTAADAQKWFEIIKGVAGATGPAEPHSPVTPIAANNNTAEEEEEEEEKLEMNEAIETPPEATTSSDHKAQEAGVTGVDKTSPEPVSSVTGTESKETAPEPATTAAPATTTEEKKAVAAT